MDTRIWDWTDPRGYLSAAEQLRLTRRYLTSIYNLFLKEDTAYFKYAFGSVAQNDTSIILEPQLKPFKPKLFRLISPNDSIFSSNGNVLFKWNSTYSLNLNDTVKYKLLVSRDSSFSSISLSVDNLMDTSYLHQLVEVGIYFWKVIAYTSDSTYTESNVNKFKLILTNYKDESYQPLEFRLEQNFPNPFNPCTTISFSIPSAEFVTLKVFDMLGREVTTLLNENLKAGFYSYNFDLSNLVSGVYLYKLQTYRYSEAKKMILIR
jgi:hypothetical protein